MRERAASSSGQVGGRAKQPPAQLLPSTLNTCRGLALKLQGRRDRGCAVHEIDDPLVRSFQQGVEAREKGGRLADNPYCPGSAERAEWAKGWGATLDLDEEADPASDRIRDDD